MTTPSNATLLDQAQGIELWRLAPADSFMVRATGRRRARLLGSLDSARDLYCTLVRQAKDMRAH